MSKAAERGAVFVVDDYQTGPTAKTLRLNGQTVRYIIDGGELRAVRVGQRGSACCALAWTHCSLITPVWPTSPHQSAGSPYDRLADLQDQIRGICARVELFEQNRPA